MPRIITENNCGIELLADVLEKYPGYGILPYHRVSEHGSQTAGGKLQRAAEGLRSELARLAPDREIHDTVFGVEPGKMMAERKMLRQAAELAKQKRPIIVAWDLSRFIRAEAYHRIHNAEAFPTVAEFILLGQTVGWCPLATIVPPMATEAERHKAAMDRGGRCGRPRSIGWPMGYYILGDYGSDPLRAIAKRYRCTVSALERFVNRENPYDDTHLRWRDYGWPHLAYKKAHEIEQTLGVRVSKL